MAIEEESKPPDISNNKELVDSSDDPEMDIEHIEKS
jgi:hypothetical protein